MICNSNALNYSICTDNNTILDYMSNYNVTEIYGGSHGVIIDKLWGRNIPLSLDIMKRYNSDNYHPIWENGITYMYAEYNDTLEAGNVIGITEPIMFWNIYRKKNNSDKLIFLKRLPNTTTSFVDLTAVRNNDYEYYLFAETKTQFSQPSVSKIIRSQYYGYFLIDIQTGSIFKINASISAGTQTYNMNYTQYDTNTPYPSFSVGKQRYMTSSAGGLLTDQNEINKYENPVSLLVDFRNFVYNSNEKYLKTPKGEIFKVFISDYTETVVNSAIAKQPMLSQFNFTQIGNAPEDN